MSVRTSDEGTADRQLNPEAIADRTTLGVLFRQAARYGDRPLIHHQVDKVWETATWSDVQRCTLAVASALVAAGIKAGDHVVLIAPNSLTWLYCDFGIQAAGAVAVPIYSGTVPEVAQAIVENCDAVMAIASDSKLASKLKPSQTLKTIVTMDSEVEAWVAQPAAHLGDVVERLEAIQPDDVCTIVYTSGTTGDPKGAELAHRNLVDIARAVLKVHPLSESDSALSFLPYAHVFERINSIFTGMMFGGQAWISRGAEHLTEELAEVQPTIMCSVPRMYEKMYAAVISAVHAASGPRQSLFRWA